MASQAQGSYHTQTSLGKMSHSKVARECACECYVSATIAFQAQVHYRSLASVKEMSQSEVA